MLKTRTEEDAGEEKEAMLYIILMLSISKQLMQCRAFMHNNLGIITQQPNPALVDGMQGCLLVGLVYQQG